MKRNLIAFRGSCFQIAIQSKVILHVLSGIVVFGY